MLDHRIDRADRSQDLVFMFSVFTHMFPRDLALYLREFSRILKPGGKVLASMFITDQAIREHLLKVGGLAHLQLTFRHEVERGFFHNDPALVPGSTSYELPRMRDEVAAAGLEVARFAKGSWSETGNHAVMGQDMIVLRKP